MLLLDTQDDNKLEKKHTLFLILALVVIINFISSIHFLNILLIGVVFTAYTRALNSQKYNLLIYIVLTMLFVELNNGFKPFSIILLGSFIYVYLVPLLTRVVLLDQLGENLQIILLYVGIFILCIFIDDFNLSLIKVVIINLVLDLLIVRLLS